VSLGYACGHDTCLHCVCRGRFPRTGCSARGRAAGSRRSGHYDLEDSTFFNLNLQPVIPFKLTSDWSVVVLQPFVNCNFGQGWALAFAPLIAANWDAADGNEWTVPLGIGITRTTVFNGRPMTLGVQYYGNATKPDGAAGYQLRFIVSRLYPTKK